MIYEWKNRETGEVIEGNDFNKPPNCEEDCCNKCPWTRVYSVAIGKVSGAGEAPARPSK